MFCLFLLQNLVISAGFAQTRNLIGVLDYFHIGNYEQFSAGVQLRVPLTKGFCLNYRLTAGYRPGGGVYLHSYAGGALATYLLANFQDRDFLSKLGVFSAFVPEGVGYYPDKNKRIYIAVNPLGFDYWHKKTPFDERSKLSGTAELSVMLPDNKFSARRSPYIAVSRIYNSDNVISSYGFHVGLLLLFDKPQKSPISSEPNTIN